jgi:hypothetical protein
MKAASAVVSYQAASFGRVPDTVIPLTKPACLGSHWLKLANFCMLLDGNPSVAGAQLFSKSSVTWRSPAGPACVAALQSLHTMAMVQTNCWSVQLTMFCRVAFKTSCMYMSARVQEVVQMLPTNKFM